MKRAVIDLKQKDKDIVVSYLSDAEVAQKEACAREQEKQNRISEIIAE